MLVNTNKMLLDAYKGKYAIGAFNFTNLEQLKAIIETCIKLNSPCILACSESAIKYMGLSCIVSLVKILTNDTNVTFALHLDHGKSFEICKECIDNGFTSVMIDGSSLAFEENIKLSRKVVEYARDFNVSVEAELGQLKGVEDLTVAEENVFTEPNEARLFVNLTGVNSLAVSIGTSHGAYKFKGTPTLKLERLAEINKAIDNFPLVLHGASSVPNKLIKEFKEAGGNLGKAKGVDEKLLKQAISLGIAKINIDSDLRIAFTLGIRKCLKDSSIFSPRDYLKIGMEEMKKLLEYKISKVLGSSNEN